MNLTVISQTNKAITLGWPAVPGAVGFEYLVDGVRSNTWNSATTQATFSKSAKQIVVIPLGALDRGVYPPPTPPPPPPPPPGNGSVTGRWFVSSSYINRGIPVSPALDPNSHAMIQQLVGQAVQGVYFNTDVNSVAVYPVPESTPDVPVKETRSGNIVMAPFTSAMKTPGDPTQTDGHVTAMLETGPFWETQQYGVDGPQTCQGICQGDAVEGDATSPSNSISNLPTPAGLVRPRHFAAGYVPDQGLRCAIPTASGAARWPAIRSDGASPGLIPMGSCIWLPLTVDLSGLNQYQLVVARMWQYGGMWCGDSNGNMQGKAVTCFLEATTDGSTYPFSGLSLPLSLLQQAVVLAPQTL